MDWSGCELVEVIEGKVSGAPLLRGTRIPADAIVENLDAGSTFDEIVEDYPSATPEMIRAIVSYADAHRMRSAS